MGRKLLSKHIVMDSEICHGKPTFVGTRIMVWQVLEMVGEGVHWDEIEREWDGKVSKEAISEAVHLAHQAFVEQAREVCKELRSA